MKVYIEPIGKLINEFSKLPGVGAKTAQRFAYKIVNMNEAEAKSFADAIINVKKNVHYCTICGNFSEDDICEVHIVHADDRRFGVQNCDDLSTVLFNLQRKGVCYSCYEFVDINFFHMKISFLILVG